MSCFHFTCYLRTSGKVFSKYFAISNLEINLGVPFFLGIKDNRKIRGIYKKFRYI